MKRKQKVFRRSRHTDDDSRLDAPQRRGALKRLAAGGAAAGVLATLPSRWTRPVVESVALPAHAQTSPSDDGDFFTTGPIMSSVTTDESYELAGASSRAGWMSWVIPNAQAQVQPACTLCDVCARINDESITVTMLFTLPDTNSAIACFAGTGETGETLTLQAVSGSELSCGVTAPTIVSVGGTAPARTMVLAIGLGQVQLEEDPTQDCACGALSCPDLNCLLYGMPVRLASGGSRSIETLEVGDVVAALDHENGNTQPAVVTKIVKDHPRDHYWRINDSLLITNDHPMLVSGEAGSSWCRVDELMVGMVVHGNKGVTTIASLECITESVRTVYMETTADNFIVGPSGMEFVVKAGYGSEFHGSRARKRLPLYV